MSNPFKKRDEVVCIDNELSIGYLELGRHYTVIKTGGTFARKLDKSNRDDFVFIEGVEGGWYAFQFEKVITIQDNEFVKMMCSNKRMLDLPK